MTDDLEPILRSYPPECRPTRVEALGSAGGFSGARLWKLETPRGPACLRQWPAEHPTTSRLEFIQAVLWHVDQEGFQLVPVPWETRSRSGYVRNRGLLWEMTPWMPGRADYRQSPSRTKLTAALETLARFHLAAASFPLPELRHAGSPGILERRQRLAGYCGGRLEKLRLAIQPELWPELAVRAEMLCDLFWKSAAHVSDLLDCASRNAVDLQPCIRDIWHDHVLFQGSEVSAIIDFGSMRPECVSADVARLLGSLAGEDSDGWLAGLAAYERIRPLDADQRRLVAAFDRSSVLMSGLQWLEWVYLDGRTFDNRPVVIARLDEILVRLRSLAIAR